MALKALMLRKQRDNKAAQLKELRTKDADFEKREAKLEVAIGEADTQEEQDAVSAEVEAFSKEKAEHEKTKTQLETEIEGIERDLEEIEKAEPAQTPPAEPKQRKQVYDMEKRTKFFGMSVRERDDFIKSEDVQTFLQRTREIGMQKRSITGASVLIPEVVLGLIKENIEKYSKLIGHVSLRNVPGKARQNIMGKIPEGVWTEMTGKLNELTLSFSSVEVDGYKVGGYVPISNAILEDSDVALATEIITALGAAIGIALDKAILYGKGTKMPLGIVTRLVQESDPGSAPENARPWEDLHTSNVLSITGKTGTDLFKNLVTAAGNAKGRYSNGSTFWAMNEATKTKLVAEAMSMNAAGAIVTGIQSTMPVIGGAIETLSFIPNDVIIGGYGDCYLLAERGGAAIEESSHVRFIEDQTVFKGTARYDGKPVVAEAFVAIGIAGVAPTAAAVTFTEDGANG